MCPPAPISGPAEMDEFWTDESIVMSLLNFKNGCPLPSNVISDANPFQFKPSNLPAHLWYFCSVVKIDAECGFWMETGEPCEILSNSGVLGSRTTLQFYEGRSPNARKTDWVMHEYKITENSNTTTKDNRALCRLFLAEPLSRHPDVMNSSGLGPKTISNVNDSGLISKSELLEKTTDNNTGPSLDPFLENFAEMDYVLMGDYLALDDLVDPGSRSSSSGNSSCMTMTSEEYFDSLALLRELEDDIINHEKKDSTVKLNISAPMNSKEVVMRPASSESLGSGKEWKPSMEGASKVAHRDEGTSNGVGTTASYSGSEGTSEEGKKERTKRRKMMKYLCFLAFW